MSAGACDRSVFVAAAGGAATGAGAAGALPNELLPKADGAPKEKDGAVGLAGFASVAGLGAEKLNGEGAEFEAVNWKVEAAGFTASTLEAGAAATPKENGDDAAGACVGLLPNAAKGLDPVVAPKRGAFCSSRAGQPVCLVEGTTFRSLVHRTEEQARAQRQPLSLRPVWACLGSCRAGE